MTAQHHRHARTRQARRGGNGVSRLLLRAGLAVSAAGAAVAGGATGAIAAPSLPMGPGMFVPESEPAASTQALGPEAAVEGVTHTVGSFHGASASVLRPLKDLQIHPLANTGVDPLDNVVGTQVADFRPVSTEPLTGPIARGGSVRTLPATSTVAGLLPG